MAILRSIFNFQYYDKTAFQRLVYIFIVELFIEYFCCNAVSHQKRCAEAYCENRDPQNNMADPRKDWGSFVDEKFWRYIVGTLTNKDNISI